MAELRRNIKLGGFKAESIQRIGDNSEERILEARHGGKIILPISVWRRIAHRTQEFPMVFRVINEQNNRYLFCGIANFNGEEQIVSIPLWMFDQLQTRDGLQLSVELVVSKIPRGHFVKLEPLTQSFLNITDPKAVLEHCLRNYICITKEEVISIYYNRNVYQLRICETLPKPTIIVNEVDLTVDFQEMKKPPEELPEECDLDKIIGEIEKQSESGFPAFPGTGQSVGGKKRVRDNTEDEKINGNLTETTEKGAKKSKNDGEKQRTKKGIPDFDHKMGTIQFKRHKKDLDEKEDTKTGDDQKQTDRPQETQIASQLRAVNLDNEVPHRPVTRSQTRLREKTNVDNSGTDPNQNPNPSAPKKRKNNSEE